MSPILSTPSLSQLLHIALFTGLGYLLSVAIACGCHHLARHITRRDSSSRNVKKGDFGA